jgi:hypothetical protein
VAGDENGWGSKTKDTDATAVNSASSRKPNANAILPGGPVKIFHPQDVFLSENSTVVLAQIGSTPILHCEVADIGEGTVSTHDRMLFICSNTRAAKGNVCLLLNIYLRNTGVMKLLLMQRLLKLHGGSTVLKS